MTSTVTFPVGNLAPEGSVIKSTAIDASVVDADGVYRKVGPARVFQSELAAIHAIKSQAEDRLKPGDILVFPPSIMHGATMLEEEVVLIDIFSPPREDFLSREDKR